MSSKKYDDVSPFYDKVRDRYGAKITIEEGKPRKNIYGKTEEEVVLKARKLLYANRNEEFINSKGMPLAELLKFNLERRDNAGTVGDAQYNRTLYVIQQVEKSDIGSKNIKDITEKDYQEFFNKISKKYADSSIDKFYSEINQALKYAKKKKMISDNPLEDIIKSKSKKMTKPIKALTVKQQKVLSDYLFNLSVEDYQYKNVLLIQLYMGLRIGEALALKITDIDLKDRTIHIQRTLTENRDKKRVLGDTTKTNAGNRVIPIPKIIYKCVEEQVKIGKYNKDKLLFTNNDKLVSHTSVNAQFQRRLLNLGIYEKGISTHSLRHTFATRCIESGMQAIVLSKLMGHSDVRVTLNTYVSVFNEYQARSSKEVEKYYNDLDFINEENYDTSGNENTKESSKIIQFPKRIANNYYER